MKKYPIGVQDFAGLIEDGYCYVDKTEHAYRLANEGKVYFLSRPRRFGKSLFLSTLRYYFEGRRDLFKGLKIEQLEQEWVEYPVLYLDLNTADYSSFAGLEGLVDSHLRQWEERYGRCEGEMLPAERFKRVIRRACEQTGRKVVILVDEYDKPLLEVMHSPEQLDRYRAFLKGIYGSLKSEDRYIRFAFLTGVTRFSKVSVFSDLNNLKDISMSEKYQDICGIAKEELYSYFEEDIQALADKQKKTYEETCAQLKYWYDGYHFVANGKDIYNPFSVLNALDSQQFSNYWFATGTPTFLVNMLKEGTLSMFDVENVEMRMEDLSSITVDSGDPIQVLYQSGYLTIKSYDSDLQMFKIGFPNWEVKSGFYNCLAPVYFGKEQMRSVNNSVWKALRLEDVDAFIQEFKDFLPEIQYFFHNNHNRKEQSHNCNERHFQEILYIMLLSAGLTVYAEEASNKGRSDIVVDTPNAVYCFELKMKDSPESAIAQIWERNYLEKYKKTGKRLYAIGLRIDGESRTLADFAVKGEE